MIYAFIDSNIFIRVMSQGKPGCETHLFDDLRTIAKGHAIELTIPEVVLFEIERQMRDLDKLLRRHFGKIKEAVNKTTVWSEITDAKLQYKPILIIPVMRRSRAGRYLTMKS